MAVQLARPSPAPHHAQLPPIRARRRREPRLCRRRRRRDRHRDDHRSVRPAAVGRRRHARAERRQAADPADDRDRDRAEQEEIHSRRDGRHAWHAGDVPEPRHACATTSIRSRRPRPSSSSSMPACRARRWCSTNPASSCSAATSTTGWSAWVVVVDTPLLRAAASTTASPGSTACRPAAIGCASGTPASPPMREAPSVALHGRRAAMSSSAIRLGRRRPRAMSVQAARVAAALDRRAHRRAVPRPAAGGAGRELRRAARQPGRPCARRAARARSKSATGVLQSLLDQRAQKLIEGRAAARRRLRLSRGARLQRRRDDRLGAREPRRAHRRDRDRRCSRPTSACARAPTRAPPRARAADRAPRAAGRGERPGQRGRAARRRCPTRPCWCR